jgi:hypothetical protein
MSTRVSLAELAAADIRLRPSEAVAIVSAICSQHAVGTLRGIPSPGVIRLTREGEVVAEGPMTTSQDDVARAAQLLSGLLAGFDALPEYRASGALRIVIARAIGTLDLPPYASLGEFCVALSRFTTDDVRDVARSLFSAWERARATRALKVRHGVELTISDVRRARRATGLSLDHVAAVAEVPPTLLRDLEWGYMRDWPATTEGRAQVIRYARAAGLDESVVLSIAWPMIVEGTPPIHAEPQSRTALMPALPRSLAAPAPRRIPAAPRARSTWRRALVAVAAMVALIAAFALGALLAQTRGPRSDGFRVGLSDRPAPLLVPLSEARPASLPPVEAFDDRVETPAVRAVAASPRPKPRRAPAPPPRRPHKAPLLQRELFRIVFR